MEENVSVFQRSFMEGKEKKYKNFVFPRFIKETNGKIKRGKFKVLKGKWFPFNLEGIGWKEKKRVV